jgi:membrane protein DedA with SNARE-associated domain
MNKIKEVLLGIIIAVIFLMFCVFGTRLIYDTPEYERYCDYNELGKIDPINDSSLYNDMYKECSDKYELANKDYSKNMFIISLVFGILVIIICTIFININSISGGLMFGSLMFIIYGTGRYWSYMDDLMRFIVLGISLGVLLYVAYWINEKREKKNNKKVRKK